MARTKKLYLNENYFLLKYSFRESSNEKNSIQGVYWWKHPYTYDFKLLISCYIYILYSLFLNRIIFFYVAIITQISILLLYKSVLIIGGHCPISCRENLKYFLFFFFFSEFLQYFYMLFIITYFLKISLIIVCVYK